MSEFLNRIAQYTPKRLALLADELNGRLQALEAARHEAIAIVGMGCRFPGGADTPAKYWALLREGVDAITEVPRERWDVDALYDPDPEVPGKMSTRWGGFVGPVDGFDTHFFGISPREAQSMDPQQRLLLEVSWRALEDAGISPQRLEESRAGVFIGMSAADYYQLLRAGGIATFDAYTASGTAHSIASGRLSYFLGLRGPSVSIDTACSSSLVAIHQAVHSLRRGECDIALAGGVNLVLGPEVTIALSKSHMMAPDGRCKAFDARADGFVRGEGCGILVLKRLSQAVAEGDRIVAVIRGSASNQDGRSNGLTAPNGQAQEAVLREALADARCEPGAIGFVEAHGTGTSLGDPIEVNALNAVLGPGRVAPLRVGSVKANIGHLEAAAGVAGVIKVALALKHGEIPGQLHVRELNPYIPWQEMPIEVPRALTSWEAGAAGRRMGGVSSFGFSGTNVHLVLEEAPGVTPASESPLPPARAVHLLPVSARSEEALRAQLAAHAEAAKDVEPADLAHALGAGRAHFSHRVGVLAATAGEAAERLAAASRGEPQPAVHRGIVGARAPRIGFLFTGQGSQYTGMAQGLYRAEPVFRESLERCDALLRAHLPRPLLDVLFPAQGEESPIDDTAYTQPALFAVEYALAQQWLAWGVKPAMVMGHSVGEFAAACVAGVFGLEDAIALIAARGRLMGALPPGGAMAAVMADESRVRATIAAWPGEVVVAALNGPQNVVISGRDRGVEAAIARFGAEGVKATRLKVSHAFHSPLMEPMLDEFTRVAESIRYARPTIELVSNVSGRAAGREVETAAHWREHVLAPVRFADAARAMAAGGCQVLLEVGPHPTLIAMAAESLQGEAPAFLPSLRRGQDDMAQMLESVAALYVRGAEIDWTALDGGRGPRRLALPGYPFQRERYWVPHSAQVAAPAPAASHVPEALRELLHEVAWREAPAADAGLADAKSVARDVLPRVNGLAAANGLGDYERFVPGLDALAAAYIVRAFLELGFELRPGERFEAEALRLRLGILDRHRRLFERMLAILAEDGILARDASAWRVAAAPAPLDVEARYEALLSEHPDTEAELALTRRCAGGLSAVVRGAADALALLFPEGSLGDTERLYQTSPPARAFNGVIAAALEAMLVTWPAGRRLRILEVGAGTGSTTSYLLPLLRRLPAGTVDYCFTDVSPLFLRRARDKFADATFLRTQLLDIGTEPGGQGFEPGSFDIVIGSNVLHATPDLEVTLGHVRALLAPGGRLVLLEGATPHRFGDITVGLLDGWWCYADTHRRDYALMPRSAWLRLFGDLGFADAVALPGEGSGPVLSGQAVYVAEAPRAARAAARWVVVPDRAGVGVALSHALEARGDAVEILRTVDAASLDLALSTPCAGVVHLGAIDAAIDESTEPGTLMQRQQELLGGALALVQRLAMRADAAPPRLYLVTRGAQATAESEPADPSQATIWGLSHTVAMEHPDLACHRVDLDPRADAIASARALAEELAGAGNEDQVALRQGRRRVRRVIHLAPRSAASTAAAVELDPARAYLVTGGLRGLGLLVAEWLVDRGARHVVLMGRRAPDERALAAIARLESKGARVLALEGDVAREADVRSGLDRIAAGPAPLAGIVHAAGVLDDGVIAAQSWPRFATVMGPKVLGTWHLHRLAGELDFLVLFSSGASLAGSPGQSNHSAANAFEDALAWYRQARGQPTVSINWGPWAEVGAAADRAVVATGLEPISVQEGLAALEYAMRAARSKAPFACAQLAVLKTGWTQLVEAAGSGRLPPVFSELLAGVRTTAPAAAARAEIAAAEPGLRDRIRAALPNRRRVIRREHVRLQTVKVLGLARAEQVDVHEPLRQLGLDSLMAVELRNLLGRSVGRSLPATLTFDHPTVAAIVDYLAGAAFADEMGATEAPPPASSAASAPEPAGALDDLTHDELAARLASRLDRLSTQENP